MPSTVRYLGQALLALGLAWSASSAQEPASSRPLWTETTRPLSPLEGAYDAGLVTPAMHWDHPAESAAQSAPAAPLPEEVKTPPASAAAAADRPRELPSEIATPAAGTITLCQHEEKAAPVLLEAPAEAPALAESPAELPAAGLAAAAPAPLPRPSGQVKLPSLPRRGKAKELDKSLAGGFHSLLTMGSSLAIVLGLFFAMVWFLRRGKPAATGVLPKEVFEVLGRASLAARQQVHLLRVGSKLILVCVTPTGIETLTEVTDPAEIDRIAGLCRQARPDSSTAAFQQVFQQFSQPYTDDYPRGENRDTFRSAGVGLQGRLESYHA